MAKVLGKSGRYVCQQAINKLRGILATCMATFCVLGAIGGFLICLATHRKTFSPWVGFITFLALLLAILFVWKWSSRKLNILERERMNMRKGAVGETAVAITLGDFPDDFRVINDLTTPFGNLDHIVVGPTGVFVMDTKNWRGVVSSDCKGELLHNGQPTDKPLVKQFVARLMNTKEKVRTLAPGLDPYFQGVFVFTSARVDANWGTTGNVHCIRDDQLLSYVVEKNFGKRLKAHEVERLAQAFVGLAHMDADFTLNASHSTQNIMGRRATANPSMKQAG